MLLRSSISSTKKFFQKTIKNFKTFFSPGYERLPKTPPHNHSSYSAAMAVMDMNNSSNTRYQELENYYTDDSNENWGSERDRANTRIKNKKSSLQSPTAMQENNASPAKKKISHHDHGLVVEKRSEEYEKQNKNKGFSNQKERQKESSFGSIGMKREHRNCIVEQKLRELEMLDMSNVDYVLDIEEVIHYYSRLSCPVYLDIVERFFMEIYSEFFGPAWAASPLSLNSRMKLR